MTADSTAVSRTAGITTGTAVSTAASITASPVQRTPSYQIGVKGVCAVSRSHAQLSEHNHKVTQPSCRATQDCLSCWRTHIDRTCKPPQLLSCCCKAARLVCWLAGYLLLQHLLQCAEGHTSTHIKATVPYADLQRCGDAHTSNSCMSAQGVSRTAHTAPCRMLLKPDCSTAWPSHASPTSLKSAGRRGAVLQAAAGLQLGLMRGLAANQLVWSGFTPKPLSFDNLGMGR